MKKSKKNINHKSNNSLVNHRSKYRNYNAIKDKSGDDFISRRIFILLGAFFAGFLTVFYRIFSLQIVNGDKYSTKSKNNRIRLEIIPPMRGRIFDSNNNILADNVLSYSLVVNPIRSNNVEDLLKNLSKYIRFEEKDFRKYKKNRIKKHIYQNITVRGDLTEKEINKISVDLYLFPGFDIVPSYKRSYPFKKLTAHTVGYVNNVSDKDLKKMTNEEKKEYQGTEKMGRTGLEKYYEKRLHGKAGFRQVEISSRGRVIRSIKETKAISGEDLYISLDLSLQKVVADELAKYNFDGAIVAMDPNNGEILAMYSNPAFDPSLFVDGISTKDYLKLIKSPRKNLFNRALHGRYPPASTIKPLMSLAALHNFVITPDIDIDCPGSYVIPNYKYAKRFFCWKRKGGHGSVDVKKSLVESCDVFYYNIGYRLGIKRIHSYLSQFGLGKKTDIDLPSESDGLLPNKEWKQKKYSKGWLVGDTLNTSIGQGYMLCTPIQMAQFTAVLASRGKRYKPHLLKAYKEPIAGVVFDIEPEKLTDVSQDNSKAWSIINKALVSVVYGKKGTANKIKPKLDFKIAGKTGTAQVFSFKKGKRIKAADLRKKLKDNAAFVTYAPAKNPQIALAVMLENAEGGSKTAAPIAVDILEKYFNAKKLPSEQNNPEVEDA